MLCNGLSLNLTNKGVKPSKILHRLEAQFEDMCLKKTQVYDWHKKFSEGREWFENEPHSWHPHTSLTHENT